MLVSLSEVVPAAFSGHYAIGAFNVTNIETASSVLLAAEALKAPVIMQTSEKALDYAGFETLTEVVLSMAKRSSVPVVVHLDHGRTITIASACLKAGYSSVMVDFSQLPFEENLAGTKSVVVLAKAHGASVESELGTIAGREDYIQHRLPHKTDPNEAVKFIHDSGITVLAVGIGNAHGPITAQEKLDFDLLGQIAKKTAFPLVLHGASGMKADELIKAISHGVVKINIDTDLRQAFVGAVRKYLRSNPASYDIRDVLQAGKSATVDMVKQKIVMFGSIGKA